MTALWFWLRHNASSAHNRVMANWLRKRGWVVFYLEDHSRICVGGCWLRLYQEAIAAKEHP